MMKKILTLAMICLAGFSFTVTQADDDKKPGKPGKPDRPGGGKHMDPAKRADMMIKKLDKDGDNKISKEEFAAGPMAKKITKDKGAEAVGKIFAKRDSNSDGFLDKAELSKPPKRRPGGKGKPDGKGKKGKPPGAKKDGDKKKAE